MPQSLSPSSDGVFRTPITHLAAFVLSRRELELIRVEVQGGRAVFLFSDPQGRGPAIEYDFENDGEAPGRKLFLENKRLRREVDRLLKAVRP